MCNCSGDIYEKHSDDLVLLLMANQKSWKLGVFALKFKGRNSPVCYYFDKNNVKESETKLFK